MTTRLSHMIGLSIISGACWPAPEPLPDTLAPLEDILADAPGDLEEGFNLYLSEDDEHLTGHLRGYIHADIESVWDAFQQPDVVVNRRRLLEWKPTFKPDPEFEFSLDVEVTVDDIVNLTWTEAWRHGSTRRNNEIDTIAMRWQKTDGTSLIDILRGSVNLRPTSEPGITEVEMIEHLKAPRADISEVESLLTDVFTDAQAFSKGDPLPTL